MFSDVGQPQLVRCCCGEVALNPIVMPRRAGFAVQAALFGEDTPQPLLGAQPTDAPLGSGETLLRQLICDEPVAEGRVIAVGIDGGVDQVRLVLHTVTNRVLLPGVERLLRESQNPAGHRDRHPDQGIGRGQFTDQRWGYLPLALKHQFFGRFA